jgi:hypothetical protein
LCKTLLRLTQQQLRHNFNWIFLGALVPQHLYFMNPFILGPLKISYFSHHVYAHFITTLMHEWYLMWLFYYCHLTPCPTFTAENNFSKIVGIGETVSAESDFDRTLVSHEILKFRKKKSSCILRIHVMATGLVRRSAIGPSLCYCCYVLVWSTNIYGISRHKTPEDDDF